VRSLSKFKNIFFLNIHCAHFNSRCALLNYHWILVSNVRFRHLYIVEFELFINHICLFVTILYCTSYEHHHDTEKLNLFSKYVESRDYIFQRVLYSLKQWRPLLTRDAPSNLEILFNNSTTCTVKIQTSEAMCSSHHSTALLLSVKILEIQVYQSIFVSQLSPFEMHIASFLYRLQ